MEESECEPESESVVPRSEDDMANLVKDGGLNRSMWTDSERDGVAVLPGVADHAKANGVVGQDSAPQAAPPPPPSWARAIVLAQIVLATALASAAAIVSLGGIPGGVQLSDNQAWLWVRIPLGLIALFLLPGYTLGLLLFPRFKDLDPLERAGAAVGLSLAQYPLLALLLDRSPWGLSPTAIIEAVTLLTWLWGGVAAVRLAFIGRNELFTASWPAPASLTRLGLLERLTIVAGIALLGAAAWSIWTVISQPAVPRLTEFFALGSDGLAQNYPSTALPKQPISVTLGVHNLEGTPIDYTVTARTGVADLAGIPSFRVEAGDTHTETLTFALPDYGFGQHVDLLLFRSGVAEPYRHLALVIDVPQVGIPTPVRIASTPLPTVTRADPTPAAPTVPTPIAATDQ